MRLYGEIIPSFSEGIIDRTGAQTMFYLTCTMISSVDLACYGVSRGKDWVSVDCGKKGRRSVLSTCTLPISKPGRVAQSVEHLTRKSGFLGSIPGLATYFRFSFRFFKKGSCQLLAKVCARSTG